MSLDRLNGWFALVANIGVLIGIVFLVQELAQSNRIATSTTEGEIRSRFLELSSYIVSDHSFAELLVKLKDDAPLTDTENTRLRWFGLQFWMFFVSIESAYNNETLSEESFLVFQNVMRSLEQSQPGLAAYMEQGANAREGISPDSVMVKLLQELIQEQN